MSTDTNENCFIPLDCWCVVVHFLEEKDFVSLCFSVNGLWNHILEEYPYCLSHLSYKINLERSVTLNSKELRHVTCIKFNIIRPPIKDLKIELKPLIDERINQFSNLRSIKLKSTLGGNEEFPMFPLSLPHLEKLSLHFSTHEYDDFGGICMKNASFPNLRFFRIKISDIRDYNNPYANFDYVKNKEHSDSEDDEHSDSDDEPICIYLKNIPHLFHVVLFGNSLHVKMIVEFGNKVAHGCVLEVENGGVIDLSSPSEGSKLKVLSLENCVLGSVIITNLSKFRNLEYVLLKGKDYSSGDLPVLVDLNNFQYLREFVLDFFCPNDEKTKFSVSSVRSCERLRILKCYCQNDFFRSIDKSINCEYMFIKYYIEREFQEERKFFIDLYQLRYSTYNLKLSLLYEPLKNNEYISITGNNFEKQQEQLCKLNDLRVILKGKYDLRNRADNKEYFLFICGISKLPSLRTLSIRSFFQCEFEFRNLIHLESLQIVTGFTGVKVDVRLHDNNELTNLQNLQIPSWIFESFARFKFPFLKEIEVQYESIQPTAFEISNDNFPSIIRLVIEFKEIEGYKPRKPSSEGSVLFLHKGIENLREIILKNWKYSFPIVSACNSYLSKIHCWVGRSRMYIYPKEEMEFEDLLLRELIEIFILRNNEIKRESPSLELIEKEFNYLLTTKKFIEMMIDLQTKRKKGGEKNTSISDIMKEYKDKLLLVELITENGIKKPTDLLFRKEEFCVLEKSVKELKLFFSEFRENSLLIFRDGEEILIDEDTMITKKVDRHRCRHHVIHLDSYKSIFLKEGLINKLKINRLQLQLLFVEDNDLFPKNKEEYSDRIKSYWKFRHSSRIEFNKCTIESRIEARRMYYQAFNNLSFFLKQQQQGLLLFKKIKKIIPDYTIIKHHLDLEKMIVFVMRRIAECCYSLDCLEESEFICLKIINFVWANNLPVEKTRFLNIVYSILSRICNVRGNFSKGLEYVKKGFEVGGNAVVRHTELVLKKSIGDNRVFDDRVRSLPFETPVSAFTSLSFRKIVRFPFFMRLKRDSFMGMIEKDRIDRINYLKLEFLSEDYSSSEKRYFKCLKFKDESSFHVLTILLL